MVTRIKFLETDIGLLNSFMMDIRNEKVLKEIISQNPLSKPIISDIKKKKWWNIIGLDIKDVLKD